MAEAIEIKANDIIKIMHGFSKKDQQLILQKITSTLFPNKKTKQGKGSKPLLVPSPNVTISELLGKYKDGIPELEGEEEIKKRYALTLEQLEPLKELFKDAPSAEELVKML